MFEGQDIVDLAMTRRGQPYVLGATVHLANPNWSGPWDCAEFVSWAAYHAYKLVVAVRPPNIQTGESYSGWWQEDAIALGGQVAVKQAIATPGAILIRQPGFSGVRIGHVAISRGDNTTIEAHSARDGVTVVANTNTRLWSTGFLLPGVAYAAGAPAPRLAPPRDVVQLTSPYTRGAKVAAIQRALLAKGVDPGPADGVFGPATAAAVAAFQAMAGIVVDGVVGPDTRSALGL